MGTNYYYRTNICKTCGRYEEVHVGKSSVGWQFTFHMPEGIVIKSAKAMRTFLDGKLIFDEYGKTVTHEEFWEMVESKQGKRRNEPLSINVEGYDFIDSDFS
jgi:hypothetical protein